MKRFEIEPGMRTMGGVFYPTGYVVLMFPTEKDAREAERKLEADGNNGERICLLTPAEIQHKIARTVDDHPEEHLPSAGTEAETARHFVQLAKEGHWALMIHAPSHQQSEHVMEVLRGSPISYGQKYRHLVIEDLVE